jgi:hypothetical protein
MAVDGRGARRHIAIAVAAGFALRLAFGLFYWVGQPLTHDEQAYLALADSLSRGHGFVYTEPPSGTMAQIGRAPGYPAFLAAIGAGSTTATASPARVKIVQAFLGALTVWLIALAAARASGARAAVVAAWLAAVYPPLVWISSYVFSETLYSLLAIGTALTLQSAVDRGRTGDARRGLWLAAAAGLLCGASILVRPAMLFFLPLAFLWLSAYGPSERPASLRQGYGGPPQLQRRREGSLAKARLASSFVISAAIVVMPWTIRNARVHDRFVLVASEGGVTFWTGNHPLAIGEGDLAANPDLKRADLEFRAAHPGLTPEQLEPLYYRDAFAHIASDPLRWLGLVARKAFYTIVPAGPSYALHSFRYRAASIVSYVLVLPFAVAGLARVWRSPRRPAALLLLAAASLLVCLVFFPQERFRIPVIDPVLILLAALRVANGRPR